MSSSKSLIINCGASHAAAAVFSANNGQLTLECLDTRELRYDTANDEAWLPALAEALRDLSRANSKFRGKATFILPGNQLLTKPIKVPHVEAAKQSQIIAFEAQNNLPIPLVEAVWGSQVVADDGVETEVVLVAQKIEQANRFCGLMTSIGCEPISLQAGSLLDYNSYKLVHEGEQEDTLIVNIGARSTNLTFISATGFFVRNINLGGNAFTQMIADGIGKSFAQAEQVKVAFYSGQTNFDADDPAVAPIQTKAQDFMKKMSQQITQSIIAYRRASNRPAPARILLAGRGGLLSGLPEFLSESQKVSVDYFNPATTLVVGRAVAQGVLDQQYFQLSEVIGEATRLIKKDAVGVNLLPTSIRQRLEFERKKPFLVMAGLCLALAPAPMVYKYWSDVSASNNATQSVITATSSYRNLQTKIAELGDKSVTTRGNISQFEDLMNSRFNWIMFFSDLQKNLYDVRDVWLDSLQVKREAVAAAPGRPGAAPARAAAAADTTPAPDGTDASAPPKLVTTYKLHVTGRMLLRDFDPNNPNAFHQEESIKRLNTLVANFNKIPFVKSVEPGSVRPDFNTDKRFLGFEFWVDIDPDKPL